ncbi:MAG TPA: hypothetical protein VGM67_12435 [Gemmatimonadaceae bacterium]|jgi:hypothetical protein
MFSHIRFSTLAVALVVSAAAAGAAGAQDTYGNMAKGQVVNGIPCDAQEGQRVHIHQHVVIFDHGKQVPIPENVGQVPLARCLYWIHTHTPDGIIHIEAPQNRSFTLGDFFAVWGQPLSRTQAATAHAEKGQALHVWVNGKPYVGDPSKIALVPHADIVIESGPPFPKPPVFTNWGKL